MGKQKLVWRTISANQKYEVSNYGKVRKKSYVYQCGGVNFKMPHEYLKQYQNNGYMFVNFNGRSFAIHKLVADAFIPEIKGCPVVVHKDGNKLHNFEWNLQRISHKGMMQKIRESKAYHSSKGNSHCVSCKENGKVYPSVKAAYDDLKTDRLSTFTYDGLRSNVNLDRSTNLSYHGVTLYRLNPKSL